MATSPHGSRRLSLRPRVSGYKKSDSTLREPALISAVSVMPGNNRAPAGRCGAWCRAAARGRDAPRRRGRTRRPRGLPEAKLSSLTDCNRPVDHAMQLVRKGVDFQKGLRAVPRISDIAGRDHHFGDQCRVVGNDRQQRLGFAQHGAFGARRDVQHHAVGRGGDHDEIVQAGRLGQRRDRSRHLGARAHQTVQQVATPFVDERLPLGPGTARCAAVRAADWWPPVGRARRATALLALPAGSVASRSAIAPTPNACLDCLGDVEFAAERIAAVVQASAGWPASVRCPRRTPAAGLHIPPAAADTAKPAARRPRPGGGHCEWTTASLPLQSPRLRLQRMGCFPQCATSASANVGSSVASTSPLVTASPGDMQLPDDRALHRLQHDRRRGGRDPAGRHDNDIDLGQRGNQQQGDEQRHDQIMRAAQKQSAPVARKSRRSGSWKGTPPAAANSRPNNVGNRPRIESADAAVR